ncbi:MULTISPECIES: methylenetetrahydrofolate reductase [NAD(P)H] [unclassified Polynucleobacter]|uniref:methylenetetrahydrofolate reductase [NAD(P)H] n=1 Tax=unclassified Polynucleobacter TaxID=2640945 RepID=UPI0025725E16|nr:MULTISPECIES: methylenetetrahydrofolate reductase [NAD(P)H] [unclassified Polynucleobacter]BEI38006.1 methylenetetrahydrofolate reductase [NAD(P)H] [Polynucleobacter sp. HIN7]BEI41798.1 methylenetetrahydrofolate reductase [NAD(P)H] [Polynucleobacter sp. HIN9]
MELSVEFFPPKTPEGEARLLQTRERITAALQPAFYSVTFGAGGSTQSGTLQTVEAIHRAGEVVAPHLSCVGSSKELIGKLLAQYKALGIKRIVALRGDLPSGMGQYGELQHANQLVEFIRQETGDWFHIEVAAYPETHPQAQSPSKDVAYFAQKIKAGANSAITQYFFNSDAYFRFVDDAYQLGVDVPVVAGIMPITSSTQLLRFSDACGAEIPRWIRLRLLAYGDDSASIKAFGEDVVSALCEQLIVAGVPGLHFYSLNQAEPVIRIAQNLQLDQASKT